MMVPGRNGVYPTGRRLRPARPDRTLSEPSWLRLVKKPGRTRAETSALGWRLRGDERREGVRRPLSCQCCLLLGDEAGACCGDPAAPDSLALGLPLLLSELF